MLFTVLIPCHNSRRTLPLTLGSVCGQLDARHNQVIVVDDCSPDGPYDDLLEPYPDVCLIRNGTERGGTQTHNQAIALARGSLVHIVHGDDWPLEGFYAVMEDAARAHPAPALYAGNVLIADRDGIVRGAPRAAWLGDEGRTFQPLHHGNPLAVAACVVRRSFYEEHGGWDERLPHVSDWEVWVRATTKAGALAINWPLAVKREYAENHSGRLQRTGENIRDCLRLADVVRGYAPHLVDDREYRAFLARAARHQETRFRRLEDGAAAAANAALAAELEGG